VPCRIAEDSPVPTTNRISSGWINEVVIRAYYDRL
jgi:hypothetical protein